MKKRFIMSNGDQEYEKKIEEEVLYDEQEREKITEPFNPQDVDIISQPMVISNIVEQLQYEEIILDPDFQRSSDLWDPQKQSRLIESLIIKIPLPTFYFDDCGNDKYIVVDGLQRLYTLKKFMVLEKENPDRLRLTGLEYLAEFEGCLFEELPTNIQRRIKSQNITAYIIRPGTPDRVRTSIFTRINTGGLTLSPAEIKNSVYRGQAANLLKKLAHSDEFIRATRHKVDPTRKLDCEFVNRFLAFYIIGPDEYQGSLEDFLNDVMIRLQGESQEVLNTYQKIFLKAMHYAWKLFGERAFRRRKVDGNYGPINRPLFESVSVNLARLSESECEVLIQKKNLFEEEFVKLFKDEIFTDSISNGTAKIENVKIRHKKVYEVFRRVIKDDKIYSN